MCNFNVSMSKQYPFMRRRVDQDRLQDRLQFGRNCCKIVVKIIDKVDLRIPYKHTANHILMKKIQCNNCCRQIYVLSGKIEVDCKFHVSNVRYIRYVLYMYVRQCTQYTSKHSATMQCKHGVIIGTTPSKQKLN